MGSFRSCEIGLCDLFKRQKMRCELLRGLHHLDAWMVGGLHNFRFVFVEHETKFQGAIPLTRKRSPLEHRSPLVNVGELATPYEYWRNTLKHSCTPKTASLFCRWFNRLLFKHCTHSSGRHTILGSGDCSECLNTLRFQFSLP